MQTVNQIERLRPSCAPHGGSAYPTQAQNPYSPTPNMQTGELFFDPEVCLMAKGFNTEVSLHRRWNIMHGYLTLFAVSLILSQGCAKATSAPAPVAGGTYTLDHTDFKKQLSGYYCKLVLSPNGRFRADYSLGAAEIKGRTQPRLYTGTYSVSAGELRLLLSDGMPPDQEVVFNIVGKYLVSKHERNKHDFFQVFVSR